jgi:hypothetical protein
MRASFPTVSAGGFSAYIDFLAYEPTGWRGLIHALSLFGHKTAVEAVRVRLRAGEAATLTILQDLTAHLALPETFVSRTRRTGEVTHATLLRDPRSLTAQSFPVLVRDDEDPMPRFHRLCDGLVTTPLHPTWAPWLWRWATQSGALQALQSVGCRAWHGRVDEVQLEQALRGALADGLLRIPAVASSSSELWPATPP